MKDFNLKLFLFLIIFLAFYLFLVYKNIENRHKNIPCLEIASFSVYCQD